MGGSWFRAHSHIPGAVLMCTGDSEAQGGEGHLGLLCPPYHAPREPPGPGEGKGGGRAPTAAAADGLGKDLPPTLIPCGNRWAGRGKAAATVGATSFWLPRGGGCEKQG